MTNAQITLKNAIEARDKNLLTAWESNFVTDIEARFPDKKALRDLSSKQYAVLNKIADKNTDNQAKP